jgi:hypothetical protein
MAQKLRFAQNDTLAEFFRNLFSLEKRPACCRQGLQARWKGPEILRWAFSPEL